jgi:NCAIR mutase (PurE)-related protein
MRPQQEADAFPASCFSITIAGMNRSELEALTKRLLRGDLPVDAFVGQLLAARSAELGEVTLDVDRQRRCGFPEVIFGEGKTVETLCRVFHALRERDLPVLATRISPEKATALCEAFPTGVYNASGRTFRLPHRDGESPAEPMVGQVAVVTAGTSDLPVAEEARETLDWMGVSATMIHDVGVAGPHRLPLHLETLNRCDAVVVVAGLEGALPSVVGGYVACPVIAVPTSVGYGASLGGLAALLGMLNSCASNVTVVNIDAGFKAGYVAGLIARRRHE